MTSEQPLTCSLLIWARSGNGDGPGCFLAKVGGGWLHGPCASALLFRAPPPLLSKTIVELYSLGVGKD